MGGLPGRVHSITKKPAAQLIVETLARHVIQGQLQETTEPFCLVTLILGQ